MWDLKGNEKSQEELDAYSRGMKFTAAADALQKKRTITLESVIWRMVFKREPTCYVVNGKEAAQCGGNRLRSVEDIYSVAKHYCLSKREVTREDVEKAMEKLIKKNLVRQSYCGTVHRRVHQPAKAEVPLKDIKAALKE